MTPMDMATMSKRKPNQNRITGKFKLPFGHYADTATILAECEADRCQTNVNASHLLLGIARDTRSVAGALLNEMGISFTPAGLCLEHRDASAMNDTDEPITRWSKPAKKILKRAVSHAQRLGQEYVTTVHIIYSIMLSDDAAIESVLQQCHSSCEQVAQRAGDKLAAPERFSLNSIRAGLRASIFKADGVWFGKQMNRIDPELPISPAVRAVLSKAVRLAVKFKQREVVAEHIIASYMLAYAKSAPDLACDKRKTLRCFAKNLLPEIEVRKAKNRRPAWFACGTGVLLKTACDIAHTAGQDELRLPELLSCALRACGLVNQM
jgi:hypothetical protein